MKKQYGFSMIELMLASVLGLVLIGGVMEIFISNKASYKTQEGIARIQENGRMLHRFLTFEIRPAGYQGCMNLVNTPPNILVSSPSENLAFSSTDVISGHDYDGGSSQWQPSLPNWLTTSITGNAIEPGTDVIIIRKAASESVNLNTVMTSTTNGLVVPERIDFAADDTLFITDCHRSDIFKATGVAGAGTGQLTISHDASSNTSPDLSKLYQTDAEVTRLELLAFYVKDTGRRNRAGDKILSLYRQELDGTEREIIEGIENIQITYGIDTTGDGNADTFSNANTVSSNNQWDKVVSVNIAALINSIEAVNEMKQGYTFDGTTISTPDDFLARRQWNVYITLRNRTS